MATNTKSIPESIKGITLSVKEGDSSSFGTLFQYYRPYLLAQALRICGNTPNAQDAVQDTFISAFTHLHSLRDPVMIFPWLKKILENHCYMLLRKSRFTEFNDVCISNDTLLQESIDQHFENISNVQSVWEALRLLSEELRSCVMLRYFSSFKSYDEIAAVLNIPIGTVRSRLNAAHQKLSENFFRMQDADDASLREAKQWSAYYEEIWNNFLIDLNIRNELYRHLHPELRIRFTSGKYGIGRKILENEVDQDLYYGSCLRVKEVISSGNISIIEASLINSPEYPDRCPPSNAFIAFRSNGIVHTAHIFDSPRP